MGAGRQHVPLSRPGRGHPLRRRCQLHDLGPVISRQRAPDKQDGCLRIRAIIAEYRQLQVLFQMMDVRVQV
jgi:hypothetical protein